MTDMLDVVRRVLDEHQDRFHGMHATCTCDSWETTAEESPDGHDGPHREHVALQIVEALTAASEELERPASCDGSVDCQSTTDHMLCCQATSRRTP